MLEKEEAEREMNQEETDLLKQEKFAEKEVLIFNIRKVWTDQKEKIKKYN